MKIVVISDPLFIQKEHDLINALFEEGLDYFHLRKPDYTESEMADYLKMIKPTFLKKISIHSHYRLIEKYNLRGIHLTNKYLEAISEDELKDLFKLAKKKGLQISTSIHNLSELSGLKYNYVFLSPVFDSISKPQYKSVLNPEALKEVLRNLKSEKNHPAIIALGGMTEDKIEKISDMGFDGFALMGVLWNKLKESEDLTKTVALYNSIKLKCQTAGHTY
jgi:thiamine-phosphate pyrophosphorylase